MQVVLELSAGVGAGVGEAGGEGVGGGEEGEGVVLPLLVEGRRVVMWMEVNKLKWMLVGEDSAFRLTIFHACMHKCEGKAVPSMRSVAIR